MSKITVEDFASDENYEDGIVENTLVVSLKEETEIERLRKSNTKLELKNHRYKDNTEIRRALVVAFTTVIVFWLLSVLLILVGNNCNHYNLSENTLIALMVTSTANVIGMMIVILKNIFPEKNKGKNKPTDQ